MTVDEANAWLVAVEGDLVSALEVLAEVHRDYPHPDLPRVRRRLRGALEVLQGVAA